MISPLFKNSSSPLKEGDVVVVNEKGVMKGRLAVIKKIEAKRAILQEYHTLRDTGLSPQISQLQKATEKNFIKEQKRLEKVPAKKFKFHDKNKVLTPFTLLVKDDIYQKGNFVTFIDIDTRGISDNTESKPEVYKIKMDYKGNAYIENVDSDGPRPPELYLQHTHLLRLATTEEINDALERVSIKAQESRNAEKAFGLRRGTEVDTGLQTALPDSPTNKL